ncbi:hypothetical protein O7608_03470 [Solwaraspora sp. WMMA2056]|uniref:hypothetical protein n=1 Tax=Solwaraspora sp. WMMA2056 TaxID=3015161 RepID=UPI00259BBF2B|nr:hypothetical protein [Solwaraspora sp. WMMA2056]WJK41505.1 hypothetical protein O7608_03470 [Solwaraspora sp. WMMA2056]
MTALLAPPLLFLLATYLMRPGPESASRLPAAGRRTIVLAALLTGTFAELTVELWGVVGGLTAPVIGLTWLAALVVLGVAAALRWRRDGRPALRTPAARPWVRLRQIWGTRPAPSGCWPSLSADARCRAGRRAARRTEQCGLADLPPAEGGALGGPG